MNWLPSVNLVHKTIRAISEIIPKKSRKHFPAGSKSLTDFSSHRKPCLTKWYNADAPIFWLGDSLHCNQTTNRIANHLFLEFHKS